MRANGDISFLREKIRRLEGRALAFSARSYVSTGARAIDTYLEGGLLRGAIHEFFEKGPHSAFTARASRFVAGILAQTTGPVIWVGQNLKTLYGIGLQQEGVALERLYCVEAEPAKMLGICEDLLREPGLDALVAELRTPLGLAASRRLQLAAQNSGSVGLFLHGGFSPTVLAPFNTCVSRWRIGAKWGNLPDKNFNKAFYDSESWCVELLRYRFGQPAFWLLEKLNDPSHSFTMAAVLAHGPLVSPTGEDVCPPALRNRAA